jgi:hypothetical protein
VGTTRDARLAASWRRRRELVAGGERPSRLGAGGASGRRQRKWEAAVAGGRRGGSAADPSACGRDGGEPSRFGLWGMGLFYFFRSHLTPISISWVS